MTPTPFILARSTIEDSSHDGSSLAVTCSPATEGSGSSQRSKAERTQRAAGHAAPWSDSSSSRRSAGTENLRLSALACEGC